MFGIRNIKDHSSWLVFQPGARLDHWGPLVMRCEFKTREDAEKRLRQEQSEGYAEVVPV